MKTTDHPQNTPPTNRTAPHHPQSRTTDPPQQGRSTDRPYPLTRRAYLAGASLCGITATAGCLGWFSTEEDEQNEDGDGEEDDEEGESEESEDSDAGEDSDGDEEQEEEGDEDENEQKDEEDEEDELVPDREDVEPDRDEYDEPEERDVIERDSDDVSVDASAQEEDGLIVISGSVTNVSDEDIDAVDLYFELYDSGGEYIGGRLVSVGSVDAGDSASFEEEVWADELRGVLTRVEIGAVEVYDFPEDNEDGDDDGSEEDN